MTMLIVFVAPLAGRFSDKIGSRWLMGAGLVLLSGSLLSFSTLGRRLELLGHPPRARCSAASACRSR